MAVVSVLVLAALCWMVMGGRKDLDRVESSFVGMPRITLTQCQ